MKCMHCLVNYYAPEVLFGTGTDVDGRWAVRQFNCPSCGRMNLYLAHCEFGRIEYAPGRSTEGITKILEERPIRPKGSGRAPCPQDVPAQIAEDYKEACLVLADSPKASAALSRRCLQNLLRDAAKVKPGHLVDEIQQVLDSGQLPTHLAQSIDAIRNTGNFAAHPIKSQTTGAIVPVEPGEAEWNLDVLESLFDFYYVQPKVIHEKRAALDRKLTEAGKAPLK